MHATRSILFPALMIFALAGCQTQKWSGTWQSDQPDHGGDLHCTVKPIDDRTWQAHFTGYCGRTFAYNVTMKGYIEGAAIVFDDKTDLGQPDGGVYDWTAMIKGEQFDGQYVSQSGKKGTFTMTRR